VCVIKAATVSVGLYGTLAPKALSGNQMVLARLVLWSSDQSCCERLRDGFKLRMRVEFLQEALDVVTNSTGGDEKLI
jgi:hypothetical protein